MLGRSDCLPNAGRAVSLCSLRWCFVGRAARWLKCLGRVDHLRAPKPEQLAALAAAPRSLTWLVGDCVPYLGTRYVRYEKTGENQISKRSGSASRGLSLSLAAAPPAAGPPRPIKAAFRARCSGQGSGHPGGPVAQMPAPPQDRRLRRLLDGLSQRQQQPSGFTAAHPGVSALTRLPAEGVAAASSAAASAPPPLNVVMVFARAHAIGRRL